MQYKEFADYLYRLKASVKEKNFRCTFDKCPKYQVCPQMKSGIRILDRSGIDISYVFENASGKEAEKNYVLADETGALFSREVISRVTAKLHKSYSVLKTIRSDLKANEIDGYLCFQHLLVDLSFQKPKLVVAVGMGAFTSLYEQALNKEELPPSSEHTMLKLRGSFFKMVFKHDRYKTAANYGTVPEVDHHSGKAIDYETLIEVMVYVGFHPALVMKSPITAKFLVEDANNIVDFFTGKVRIEKTPFKIENIKALTTTGEVFDYLDYLTYDLKEPTTIAFDTETSNLNRKHNNKFLTWQFSAEDGKAVVFPVEHRDMPLFLDPKLKEALRIKMNVLINNPESPIEWFTGHNIKFDLSVMWGLYGVTPRDRNAPSWWCTQLGMHWLDENRKKMTGYLVGFPYSLKTLAKEFFNFSFEEHVLENRGEGLLEELNLDQLFTYGGSDAILTRAVQQEQMKQALVQPDNAYQSLVKFQKHYYFPASWAVSVMECNGIYVKPEQLSYLQGEDSPIWGKMEKSLVELQTIPEVKAFRKEYANKMGGKNSLEFEEDLWGMESDDLPPLDLDKEHHQRMFYLDFLRLSALRLSKKTGKESLNSKFLEHNSQPILYKNNPTIRSNFLEYYDKVIGHDEKDGTPIYRDNPIKLHMEYRKLKKLGTSYLNSIETMLTNQSGDCVDSRVRASFNLAGTDTGRLSSQNPNFQNLPAGRSKHAKEVKNMFQAEPPSERFPNGTILVQGDYKTAEVRWAALISNDTNLIKIFSESAKLIEEAVMNDDITDEEFNAANLLADLHRRTASLMIGMPAEKITKNQRQSAKCLVGSTLLYTDKGIIPIDSLVADTSDDRWLQLVDNVITASKNKPASIVAINHKWVSETIELESSIGTVIEGDKDHPLLVWRDCRLVECAMKDIVEGDYLVISRQNDVWVKESPKIAIEIPNVVSVLEEEETVECALCGARLGNINTHLGLHGYDTSKYLEEFPDRKLVSGNMQARRSNALLGSKHNIEVLKSPTEMTPELARILGYLVAEGDGQNYVMSGSVKKSPEMLADFQRCVFECFGIHLEVLTYPYTNTGTIRLPNKVKHFLISLGLEKSYSETKYVPAILMRSRKQDVIDFLRAYFEGDGSVKDNSIVIMSASERLMREVQQLLLNLGIVSILFSEVHVTPVSKESRTYHGLRMCLLDAVRFRDIVGFTSTTKQAQASILRMTHSKNDCIHGLNTLLSDLKDQYKIAVGSNHHAINGIKVKFGDRRGGTKVTRELLASRPYVMESLKVWSETQGNSVYQDISWLCESRAYLSPVKRKLIKKERKKVYDIEVADSLHVFVGNGFYSKNCITFGLLFGMAVKTLAENNGWSEEEAQEKLNKYFSAFPHLHAWLNDIKRVARRKGYVTTFMDRRRRLSHFFAVREWKFDADAERKAMNSSIQGQSSDAMTIGMFSFMRYIFENNLENRWFIENMVHDSCLVQVPKEDLEKVLVVMKKCHVYEMKEYIEKHWECSLAIPIEMEFEIGLTYGGLRAWDGRKKTLAAIKDAIDKDAEKLWKVEDKPKTPSTKLDLVSFRG